MSKRDVHIVFQVLNFLHGNESSLFNLTPIEKLILINLASHLGRKGIYPSIFTICKELKLTKWPIIRALQSLELKTLLFIEKSTGKANHYKLQIPDIKLSTTSSQPATSSSPATGSSPATELVANQHLTSSSPATLYNIEEQLNKNIDVINPPIPPKVLSDEKLKFPDWINKKDWDEFLEHRKSLKSPMTKTAQSRAISGLEKLKNQGQNVSDVINQSIVNGWKGLFPIYKDRKYGNKRKSNSQIMFDSCKGALEGTKYDSRFYDEDGERIIDEDPFESKIG